MSNERIDLTQFEGISPAKEWGLVYPERPQRTSVRTGDGLYYPHCRADDIEVRRANMALMAAAPDLLAELKRCYEEIDNLLKQECRLIDIAERGGAWEGNFDYSDINEKYGACQSCGSIPSGCCEPASE